MIHIYAWDPGETTGWCHLSVFENEIGVFDCGEADHNQIGNMLYDNQALRMAIERPELEVVFIVERYVMNSKIAPAPWSLETTGLIRYFADRSHVPLELVSPSTHKALIKDEVIKRAGLWVPRQGHAMDAVRIALWFLIAKKSLLKNYLRGGEGPTSEGTG